MSKELRAIEERRIAAENELKEMEKFIYKLETNYLRDTSVDGNILKGWDAMINSKSSKSATYPSKKQNGRSVMDKERIFSASSCTVPCKLADYENTEISLPSKRKAITSSKAPKKGIKRRNSDTDDYSEEVA
jgi:chromatin modification-related protein EAF6